MKTEDKQPHQKRRLILALLIPVAYGLLMRLLFEGSEQGYIDGLYEVMSGGFLFVLPIVMGALLVYISGPRMAANWAYRIFAPWMSVFSFLVASILISLEGWGCWLMMLPVFLILSTVGGILGGWLRTRREARKGRLYVSLLALLPLAISPVEHRIGPSESVYEAANHIDIHAPAAVIWAHVTRVREIGAGEDRGWLTHVLHFPRPLRAELDYEGVGASREAWFTGGLVFHEQVVAYEHQKKMVFSIKAYPHEIPAATMDEHIIIGGKYFDVLNGTYELEQLNDSTCRLRLYSRFVMNTTFNWYASMWGRWIMQDIQQNILQIEKQRSEAKSSTGTVDHGAAPSSLTLK